MRAMPRRKEIMASFNDTKSHLKVFTIHYISGMFGHQNSQHACAVMNDRFSEI